MTALQCECGQFRAQLDSFPKNSPGRCVCYCDDCQTFMHFLGRSHLMDSFGGSEIIPVYPSEFKIVGGKEFLSCVRLSPKGLFRFYASCCKTPIGNVQPRFPWVGTSNAIYEINGSSYLQKSAGPIKSRIQGRFAKGTPPAGTSDKMGLKDILTILPFVLKGFLKGKAKGSPFFQSDETTPVVPAQIMTLDERNDIRQQMGFKKI